jgi:hydrogenase maturation protein HypF
MTLADSYLKEDLLPINFVESLLESIFHDLDKDVKKQHIAAKFHVTLVDYIIRIAKRFKTNKIAFSGGVFQNALLVDLVLEFMKENNELYFQNEFSPNDEGIPFGQLMYFTNKKVNLNQ